MYYKFTKKTMPPLNERILIWMDADSTDGGFAVIGQYCQYNGEEAYIRYVTPDGWRRMEDYNRRHALWSTIEMPERAKARMRGGTSPRPE